MDNDFGTGYALGADSRDGNDGWGGQWIWAFLIIALIFGGGGFFGRNNADNGALTRSDLCEGFNFQNVENGIRGVQNGLCDGFYAQNTTMLQGFNGIQRDLCTGFASVNAGISENRFASQQCCCETNRNIDSVRAENYRNTCDITTAIHQEAEATRALINANTMQDLRDKLADKDRDIQARDFQLSQISQTASIVNQVRPCPTPAYITCNPWGNTYGLPGYGYNGFGGCGCNSGCGC